jgi:alpha-beta hydrolase superfamily lysophospholipase
MVAGGALAVVLAMLGVAVAAVVGASLGGSAHHRRAQRGARTAVTRAGATRTSAPDSAAQSSTAPESTGPHATAGPSPATGSRTTGHRLSASPRGPFRVIRTELSLVEPASASSDPAAGPRRLPTVVRYPVLHPGVAGPHEPLPLIVFSQGFAEPAESYAGLLHAWAAAGFVVADPTYPRTDPDAPAGPDESDIVNHPADLRFVIGALTHAAAARSSPLHDRIDAGEVAVVGQSDGGDVSLAVAEDSCCRDAAVRAAVILSGAELASFGGRYFGSAPVPLLVVQGTADTINAPACSAQIYDDAPQPKYYLNMVGAEHLPPYQSPGPVRSGVARVVVAFLQAFLERRPTQLHWLAAQTTLGGGLRLSHGREAPVPAGVCPGAP